MGSGQSNSTVEDVDIFIQELIEVAQKKDTSLLQTKIEQSSFGIEAKNRHSKTALRIAVEKRNLKAVRGLLKQNANVNTTCEHNETPLMVAAKNGDLDILECLLENQAKVKEISNNGLSAIVLAARNRHVKCLKRLLKQKVESSSPNHDSERSNQESGDSNQESKNSNQESRDPNQGVPVSASYYELENALTCRLDDEGVLLLLKNLHPTDDEKNMLLCEVIKQGLANTVEHLLNEISDSSTVIERALVCAMQSKNEKCIRTVVLKYNQSKHNRETGRRAIVTVMENGLKEDCKKMLQLDKHQTSSPRNFLQLCNGKSATSTVQTLVRQDDKEVALQKAAEKGYCEILRLLISNLAEPVENPKQNVSTSASDNGNCNASESNVLIYEKGLVAAAEGRHADCVQILVDEINKFPYESLKIYSSTLIGAVEKYVQDQLSKFDDCSHCKGSGVVKIVIRETEADDQQASDNSRDQQASVNSRDQQASDNSRDQQASDNSRDHQAADNSSDQQDSDNSFDQQASDNSSEQQKMQNCIEKINSAVLKKLEAIRESFKNIKSSTNGSRVEETDFINEANKLPIVLKMNGDYHKMQKEILKLLKCNVTQTRPVEELKNGQTKILQRQEEIKIILHEALQDADSIGSEKIVDVLHKSVKLFANKNDGQNGPKDDESNYGKALMTAAKGGHEDCVQALILMDEMNSFSHGKLTVYRSALRGALRKYIQAQQLKLDVCSHCSGRGVTEAKRDGNRRNETHPNHGSDQTKAKRMDLQF